jgi:hypothetical protein
VGNVRWNFLVRGVSISAHWVCRGAHLLSPVFAKRSVLGFEIAIDIAVASGIRPDGKAGADLGIGHGGMVASALRGVKMLTGFRGGRMEADVLPGLKNWASQGLASGIKSVDICAYSAQKIEPLRHDPGWCRAGLDGQMQSSQFARCNDNSKDSMLYAVNLLQSQRILLFENQTIRALFVSELHIAIVWFPHIPYQCDFRIYLSLATAGMMWIIRLRCRLLPVLQVASCC